MTSNLKEQWEDLDSIGRLVVGFIGTCAILVAIFFTLFFLPPLLIGTGTACIASGITMHAIQIHQEGRSWTFPETESLLLLGTGMLLFATGFVINWLF